MNRYFVFILSAIFAVSLMSGCKSTEKYYKGYLSTNTSTFDLVDKSLHQGSWETFDLRLAYQAEQKGDRLDVNGTVFFGNYYLLNSAQIVTFEFYLFMLDSEGKVIETARIAKRSNFNAEIQVRFDDSLSIPPGTESVSFGYTGESQGDGGYERGGGGGLEAFESLPSRPVNAKG